MHYPGNGNFTEDDMEKPKVLVVEDDPAVRRGLADALDFADYHVLECSCGDSALETLLSAEIDLVLLDVMLPGRDGFELLDEVRQCRPTLPVIMVTARGAEEDRIRGLRNGADDYVVKPFSARELLARVEAVLRRSPERPTPIDQIQVAGRRLELERREVVLPDGDRRQLSEREADILRYLASAPGRVISREELLRRVWGLDPRDSRPGPSTCTWPDSATSSARRRDSTRSS